MIDLERQFVRSKLGIPKDASVILFVGRITIDKGVRELLQSFHQIKIVGGSAHLVFVGNLDLESGVEGGLSPNEIDAIPDTHRVGYTEHPEEYMAIASLLCLPSYREGFGTVVIEAAAMGVPTVGSDIYGLSDAVVNHETGILVPPRDSAALASALSTLLTDEKLRAKMGAAAQRRVKLLFDANKVNEMVIDEYCNLLDGRKVH